MGFPRSALDGLRSSHRWKPHFPKSQNSQTPTKAPVEVSIQAIHAENPEAIIAEGVTTNLTIAASSQRAALQIVNSENSMTPIYNLPNRRAVSIM